jgi:glycosyltransferase involved in cell wall biosynthesis
MPVFNAAKYVEQSIRSILGQTMEEFELIVVDDRSTDQSWQIISSIDDPRLIRKQNLVNKGIVYTRNKGLSFCRGEYYAPFDADDIAFPDKLAKQVSFLQDNPTVGMVGSWAKWIDPDGNSLPGGWKLKAAPDQIRVRLLFHNYFINSSVLIRRKLIPKSGYTQGFDRLEDYMLWADLFPEIVAWNIPEFLMAYRMQSDTSLARRTEKESASEIMVIMCLFARYGITIFMEDALLLLRLRERHPRFSLHEKKLITHLLFYIWQSNNRSGYLSKSVLRSVLLNRFIKSMIR